MNFDAKRPLEYDDVRGRMRTKRPGAEEVEQGGTDNTAIHQFESDPGLLTFPLPGVNPEKGGF